jgi:alanine-synthesizing transaminase
VRSIRGILEQIIEIARQNDLIVFSDEIYDKITYDGAVHTSTASLPTCIVFTINDFQNI